MDSLPWHPVVVHLPAALAVLFPVCALAAAVLAWRRGAPSRAWWVMPVLGLLLFGSALIAMNTGEADEEKVERIVSESALEEHEQWAERFVWASGATLFVALFGLAPGVRVRRGAMALTVVGSLVVLGLGIRTAHAGGELVYVHGAADVHREADGEGPAREPAAPVDEPAEVIPGGDPNPLDLPPALSGLLRREMVQLDTAMHRLHSAIVMGRPEVAAATGQRIHDSFILKQELSKEELQQLVRSLPDDFVERDRAFHETSLELVQAAEKGDLARAGELYGTLTDACVGCHEAHAASRFPAHDAP